MTKLTVLNRINLSDTSVPLDEQIENLCVVNFAAGYELASTFVYYPDLILIFKLIDKP